MAACVDPGRAVTLPLAAMSYGGTIFRGFWLADSFYGLDNEAPDPSALRSCQPPS